MNKNCTFLEFSEYWLKQQKELKAIKESSYANFSSITRKHLQPMFGDKQINKLKPEDLQNAISYWLEKGNLKTGKGLSMKTVKDYVVIFKLIIKSAVDKKYIKDSKFKPIFPKENEIKVLKILTESEQSRLIQAVYLNLNYKSLGILLSLFTGIRIGELCALKWSDISFENKTIIITKTTQRIYLNEDFTKQDNKNTKIITTTPKSQSSVRIIPLPSMLMPIVEKLKPKNLNTFLITGTKKQTEPRTYRSWYNHFLKKHNLKEINFHGLRHTFASRAMQTTGFDLYSLSSILGHKKTSTTLDFYGGSNIEQKKTCMELLNKFL